MLHHPPPPSAKYHPNSLSQFLAMHHHHQQHQHRIASPPPTHLDDIDPTGTTHIDSAFGGIGKSFTIAAILGLKKNAAAAAAAVAMEHHHHQHQLQQQHPHSHHNPNHPNPHTHHPHQHHTHPFHLHNLANNSGGREYTPSVMNLSINNPAAAVAPACNPNLNNNNIGHSNQNMSRMPAALEKHIQHHQQNHNHLHSASSALQSLQQLQQAHGGSGTNSGFTARERGKNEHIVSKKNSLKSKRVRTIFTPEQLERLESEFERQQYMVGPERLYLAHTLQLTEAQVKVWFQNRRIKWRKHHLELTQQKLAMIRQHQGPTAAITAPPQANAAHSPSPPPQMASIPPPPECDVSVCTDSMDSRGSAHDGDDDNGD